MPYFPDVSMSLRGRLVADPTLKFIAGRDKDGVAVCNARIAHTERKRQADGKWVDGETLFVDVTCWNRAAEMLALLPAGTPLMCEGKFELKSWEGREGEVRLTPHLTAERIAVDATLVREIEGGKGWVTFKWGKAAANPAPVPTGVEGSVGQTWDQSNF